MKKLLIVSMFAVSTVCVAAEQAPAKPKAPEVVEVYMGDPRLYADPRDAQWGAVVAGYEVAAGLTHEEYIERLQHKHVVSVEQLRPEQVIYIFEPLYSSVIRTR